MLLTKWLFTFIIFAILLQGCSTRDDQTNVLLQQADNLEAQEQFAQASEIYEKAYSLNKDASPMQLYILLNDARICLQAKNYNKAIENCQKGLDICQSVYGSKDMLSASFLFVLASAYDGLKENDKAVNTYKTIMTMTPLSRCRRNVVVMMPLIKMGDIEFKRNNLQKALYCYQSADEVSASTDTIQRLISYRQALCSAALFHNKEAEFYFKKALPYLSYQSAPQDI